MSFKLGHISTHTAIKYAMYVLIEYKSVKLEAVLKTWAL